MSNFPAQPAPQLGHDEQVGEAHDDQRHQQQHGVQEQVVGALRAQGAPLLAALVSPWVGANVKPALNTRREREGLPGLCSSLLVILAPNFPGLRYTSRGLLIWIKAFASGRPEK